MERSGSELVTRARSGGTRALAIARIAVGHPLHHAELDERVEAGREQVARDAEVRLELAESRTPRRRLAHDQQCPSLADHTQRVAPPSSFRRCRASRPCRHSTTAGLTLSIQVLLARPHLNNRKSGVFVVPMIETCTVPEGALTPEAEEKLVERLTGILVRAEGFEENQRGHRVGDRDLVAPAPRQFVAGKPADAPRYRGRHPPSRKASSNSESRAWAVAEVAEAVPRRRGRSLAPQQAAGLGVLTRDPRRPVGQRWRAEPACQHPHPRLRAGGGTRASRTSASRTAARSACSFRE